MIRINLLKALQGPEAPLSLVEAGSGSKKWVLAAAAVALASAGAYFALRDSAFLGGSQEEEPALVETIVPEAEPIEPKRVTAQAVEEIVREIGAEQEAVDPAPGYADLVPSEKIEYQYFAATRLLRDIKTVTPPDVGFADFIFTPPGDFYLRGLVASEEIYAKFKQGLEGLEGANVRSGLSVKAGKRGTALEFSFFGTILYPVKSIKEPPDRVVSKRKLPGELKQLREVAASLGIRLANPKLLSATPAEGYSKMVFQSTAKCNYQQMQDLLSQLHENNSSLGFLKFSLRASGDENVISTLDILAYVN